MKNRKEMPLKCYNLMAVKETLISGQKKGSVNNAFSAALLQSMRSVLYKNVIPVLF